MSSRPRVLLGVLVLDLVLILFCCYQQAELRRLRSLSAHLEEEIEVAAPARLVRLCKAEAQGFLWVLDPPSRCRPSTDKIILTDSVCTYRAPPLVDAPVPVAHRAPRDLDEGRAPAAAAPALERALGDDEKAYGPNHPTVATYVNNLGSLLRDLGDLEGAKAHLERALAIATDSLGPDHPTTQTYRRNLERLRR